MTPDEITALVDRTATAAAKATVRETFLTLGVDVNDALEVQADFRWMRQWRRAQGAAWGYALKAAVTAAVTGVLGVAVWLLTNGRGVAG